MKRMMLMGSVAPVLAMMAADGGGGGGDPLSLHQAVNALDPNHDGDWTDTGAPAMKRLKELMGTDEVTRADVDAVLPDGFNRANAHAAPTLTGDDDADQETTAAPSDAGDATGAAAMVGDAGAEGNEEAAGVGLMGVELSSPTARAVASILEDAFDGEDFDAVKLMEASVAAGQSDRFRRNNALQNLLRGYQVAQREVKDSQARLDARIADRAAKNTASRAATAAEAEGE